MGRSKERDRHSLPIGSTDIQIERHRGIAQQLASLPVFGLTCLTKGHLASMGLLAISCMREVGLADLRRLFRLFARKVLFDNAVEICGSLYFADVRAKVPRSMFSLCVAASKFPHQMRALLYAKSFDH